MPYWVFAVPNKDIHLQFPVPVALFVAFWDIIFLFGVKPCIIIFGGVVYEIC